MKTIQSLIAVFLCILTINANAQEQLPIDSKAPQFATPDSNGEMFSLAAELKKGPVIVSFYRGSWCPYCMKQLKEIQARYNEITDKRAQFVAVTPDKESGIDKTVKLIAPSFKILRDSNLKISQIFKAISDEKYEEFQSTGQKAHKYVPVPATYIIGQDGKIKFSYFDTNYKVRALLDDLIKAL